ncbi:pilin [Thiocapsa rosea]|uniref:Prepilin-type N-terminal cleavage/methylation domain-containing protein n=1 Tax=Thiocapsa rosea TaxID=69360 RepID=A0A495VA47_9GAMM|nr:pilin [Thiocapsa rosea]RKT44668.1 prepilin-type N-terminal cleavage/methylation domain-containing protein [Thiocapsa rosea]
MRGLNRMSGKTRIRGFTLIEIMIVVAVIGILAAIALPAYQDYTVRSKVSEGLGFASAAKVDVVSAFSHDGLPVDDSKEVDVGSQYVKSVKIEAGGNIRVTFNDTIPQLTGKSVMLAATERGGAIDWCCYSTDIEARYMPASCRDGEKCGSPDPNPNPTPTPSPPPSQEPTEVEKEKNCRPLDNGKFCQRQNNDIGCPLIYPKQIAQSPNCSLE